MEDDEILAECRKALGALAGAADEPPDQIEQSAHRAARAVVRARDILISQLYEERDHALTPRRRAALDQLNAILSIIVALQFPLGGLERDRIQQACDALTGLLESGTRP